MRRLLVIAVLAAALPGLALAASPKITSLDTAGYPTVRVQAVTPKPVRSTPKLKEKGLGLSGIAANLPSLVFTPA